MNRKSIPLKTVKALFAKSNNCCAYKGCEEELVDGENVYATICHIEAYSPDGPRFNSALTVDERNEYSNLTIMCLKHSKMIDVDVENHSVELLKRMKNEHEALSTNQTKSSDKLIKLLIKESNLFHERVNLISEDLNRDRVFAVPYNSDLTLIERTECIRNSVETVFESYRSTSENGDIYTLKDNGFSWEMSVLGTTNHSYQINLHLLSIEIDYLQSKIDILDSELYGLLQKKRKELIEIIQDEEVAD